MMAMIINTRRCGYMSDVYNCIETLRYTVITAVTNVTYIVFKPPLHCTCLHTILHFQHSLVPL